MRVIDAWWIVALVEDKQIRDWAMLKSPGQTMRQDSFIMVRAQHVLRLDLSSQGFVHSGQSIVFFVPPAGPFSAWCAEHGMWLRHPARFLPEPRQCYLAAHEQRKHYAGSPGRSLGAAETVVARKRIHSARSRPRRRPRSSAFARSSGVSLIEYG